MARTARQNQEPPPDFFRDAIVALKHLFPQAAVDKEVMTELAPHLVQQWRQGQDVHASIQATCSCDGKKIFLSPAAQMQPLPRAAARRIALPPVGAQPGEVFGAEDLRDTGGILRLKVAVAVRRAKATVRDKMAEITMQRIQTARAEPARHRAQLLYARYVHERDVLLQEAETLDARLREMLQGLPPPKKPRPRKQAAPAVQAKTKAPAKRRRPKKAPATPAARAPSPKAEAPDEAAERKMNAQARNLLLDDDDKE